MLGDGRQQVKGEPVRMGHIAGDELHTPVHEVGDEGDVARQPVQLGDHERRSMQTT